MNTENEDPLAGLPEPESGERPSPLRDKPSVDGETDRWWLQDSLQPEPIVETSEESSSADPEPKIEKASEVNGDVAHNASTEVDVIEEEATAEMRDSDASKLPYILIGAALLGVVFILMR